MGTIISISKPSWVGRIDFRVNLFQSSLEISIFCFY